MADLIDYFAVTRVERVFVLVGFGFMPFTAISFLVSVAS